MVSRNQGYYDEKLSAEKLRRCYEIAPPRIRQYLQAEIDYVSSFINPESIVLELGCGYGRVLKPLGAKADRVVGIDTSMASLLMAKYELRDNSNIELSQMNAIELGFKNNVFDLVCCIQNGISAFKADNLKLIAEAVRVTRTGGKVLFSTYLREFWRNRLEWFEIQAKEGLLGEVDYSQTGDGEIVCKDGFRATTYSQSQLQKLAEDLNLQWRISEIDSSSVFLEISV
jgi:SAM-dependent methyltransferase